LVLRALKHEVSADRWRFTHVRPSRKLGGGRIIRVFGDNASQSRYHYLLDCLLEKLGALPSRHPFDFEPLEALAAFLRMPASDTRPLRRDQRPTTVGGSPQVARVVAGADTTPFAVRWSEQEVLGEFLLGRRCFPYERIDSPLISFDEHNRVSVTAPGQWSLSGED
jgi:hypothetical protein